MVLPRADRLKAPPIVGQHYRVTTVFTNHSGLCSHWPVMGLRHTDADHLNFPHEHFHIDLRFVSKRQLTALNRSSLDGAAVVAARSPISFYIGKPELRPMRCMRVDHEYPVKMTRVALLFRKMFAHFAGRQCARGKRGWVCPHKLFPFGSILPDAKGIVTCPLHGLRIHAETGVVTGVRR
jgi:hypothetical protein